MAWPMSSATMIAPQVGMTEVGVVTSSFAMTTANAALTMSSSRKMITRKRLRPFRPMYLPDSVPMLCPRCLPEAHRAPKSCIPAMNTVPMVTHRKAGTHPQITAMAGPTMGAAPATEVKWCPQSTYLLVGT